MPLIAAAAVAAGAALQSATGFGFSVVAAPLVFAAVGPEEAVGLLLVLGTEVNLLTLATEGRRPRPATRECVVVPAFALPGAFAGVAALRALDPVALQIAVSIGVIATLAARHLAAGRRTPGWAAPISGFAAGGLSTSTTTAGPPCSCTCSAAGSTRAAARLDDRLLPRPERRERDRTRRDRDQRRCP